MREREREGQVKALFVSRSMARYDKAGREVEKKISKAERKSVIHSSH